MLNVQNLNVDKELHNEPDDERFEQSVKLDISGQFITLLAIIFFKTFPIANLKKKKMKETEGKKKDKEYEEKRSWIGQDRGK